MVKFTGLKNNESDNMESQKVSLEECLANLLACIESMEKDPSSLKDPPCFSKLDSTYNALSTLKIHSEQFALIIADLPKRLKFYDQMFVSLQTKRKSGAFLDEYCCDSDIHSFIAFVAAEINMLMCIFSPVIQSKLIKNGSIQILGDMFFLKSISNALKLKILCFFRLLNWNQELEQLRAKLLAIIEDNANAELIQEYLLLLFDKNVVEPKLAPRNFFRIITGNRNLADSIREPSSNIQYNELFYKSIEFFHRHNLLGELITEFLNVIDNNHDSDWRQKKIAMYGLFALARDYLTELDDMVKTTIIKRIENALCNFSVNEYIVCQLIGVGGRSVHLLAILASFVDALQLSESDKDKIFKNIILKSKNEQIIRTILLSKKLSGYLIKEGESDAYFKGLYQDPLTLKETNEEIAGYLGFTIENDTSDSAPKNSGNEITEYENSDVVNNLDSLIQISRLSKQSYYPYPYHYLADKIIGYIYGQPMHYLSHAAFLEKLSGITITAFNFTIVIGLIRSIIVSAKCLTDEKQLNNVVRLALTLTLRLPNAFLQHNTFKYISDINTRFQIVPGLTLAAYRLPLLEFSDLSMSEPSDLLLLGQQAEEQQDFDLALRYYHKAEDLDYNYHYYAVIARALIYLRKAMPYTALDVLFNLKTDIHFDFEFYALIYNLTGRLGHVHDAVDIFHQINTVLPFYQKNILSFKTEIQLPKTHPLAAKFDALCQHIEATFANYVSHDKAIELVDIIQDSLVKLTIPRDILTYCLEIFSPIKNIESSEYSNEWKRILLNYLSFVFQEVASIDSDWQTAGAALSLQSQDKLKQYIVESEIHKVYSRISRKDCSVEQVIELLTTANVETLTVTEFVRRYGQDHRTKGGYALGYSEDIAQTYDIYCFLFGLVRWETAYQKHNLSYINDTKTPEFLDTISKENKPIVFFLPTGLSSSNHDDNYLGVTYRECQWLLENARDGNKNIKNVILVLNAYNYLPYHVLTEIKYFHKYGAVLRFNEIENRDFNEKVEIATAAARHFLTYVVDADKIQSTQQTFINNIEAYLSINIESIYFSIEDTVKSDASMSVDLKQKLVDCFKLILGNFCQSRDWNRFSFDLKDTVAAYQQNHSAVKCLAISFIAVLEDIDFLQYFIVMDQDVENSYRQYLGVLNFVSQLIDTSSTAQNVHASSGAAPVHSPTLLGASPQAFMAAPPPGTISSVPIPRGLNNTYGV